MIVLASIAGAIVLVVLLLALFNRIFFKIGVRNIPRRRSQMALIVFALMLSTTLLSSVLATGDILTATVQSVAVYNWGNIDELIEGGNGANGLYSDGVYYNVAREAKQVSNIAAVAGALRERSLLIADQTSRQVRSNVTALGVIPDSEIGFGGMQDVQTKKRHTIAQLGPNEVYLNQTLATLLNAHPGDTLYVYAKRWPGQQYTMRVAAIVSDDGLVGDNPFILSQIQTFRSIEHDPDAINQIFVANRGGGGISGLNLSNDVTSALNQWLPHNVHVIQVKQNGVQVSQLEQDIFSRIFALFCLFALAIGLLLIFLIFVLLAAERRAEMGMARAIGVQRRHLILMFLFEGAVYDLVASFIGLLAGVGIGALVAVALNPVLARFNFPLKLNFQPRSMIIAYCLGVIFTFCSVALASWLVSRMTVVEAMRDLPEQSNARLALGELGVRLLDLLKQGGMSVIRRNGRMIRRILFEHLPDTLMGIIASLILLGFLPLLLGYWLIQIGIEQTIIIPFSLGLSLIIIGSGLLMEAFVRLLLRLSRWLFHMAGDGKRVMRVVHRVVVTVIGLALVGYWALPFDALSNLGLPRFQGGIEVFFVAGVMMVLGMAWAIIVNAELLVSPLLRLCAALPGVYALAKLASAYPLHRRFRTGLSVVMFSLVVFAMTVMAVIANATQSGYADINVQTGGYDIQATSYFKPLPLANIRTTLAQHGINPNAFSEIGVRNTAVVLMMQPGTNTPRWNVYPAQVVSGGFLRGYGLRLTARAKGFASDAAVWQALQEHPNYALIDSSALPYNPNTISNAPVYDPNAPSGTSAGSPQTPPNFPSQFTYAMSGVYQGDSTFSAVPIWLTGLKTRNAVKMTIIGVVDNSDNSHFGLYIPQSAGSASSVDFDTSLFQDTNQSYINNQSYYFKVAPGQDKRALALALGSAFLGNGLETTVLEDAIWQVRGPRILLSDVLLGVVGMTLLLGVAALAITGTRAVIERRQQIGMLRALGCKRGLIQGAFLLESFLVGALGSILGVLLGLVLANNIFAANFFEQFNIGLAFSIPWQQLEVIVGIALLASFLGAILPAWQAGRIAPAEALRYA